MAFAIGSVRSCSRALSHAIPPTRSISSVRTARFVTTSSVPVGRFVQPRTVAVAGCVSKIPLSVSARALSSAAPTVINVPSLGADSISEGTLATWAKKAGDAVQVDEVVAVIDTDKVSVDIRAPTAGVIVEVLAQQGQTVAIGAPLYKLAAGAAAPSKPSAPASTPPSQQSTGAPTAPKAAPAPTPTPSPAAAAPKSDKPPVAKAAAIPSSSSSGSPSRTETRVPMSRMRMRIAERLKASQNEAAMLTTFNEIDMTPVMELRNKYKDDFAEKHGVKLGFMSFFVKAASAALKSNPDVNAVIDGKDIVYRDYVDISVAVATPTGLVVPVLRNTDFMNFAQIEGAIAALGQKARKGQIAIEDMVGGTFTISNGGVYGSMMGTPIINPPQSAILGMHGIFKRPVVINDKIEIRQMMYVALTYDHRLIDGSGAVTFLRKIKDGVEDPSRLLLELI